VLTIIEIKHKNLLKKIRNYEGILTKSKLTSLDFFVPSTYKQIFLLLICALISSRIKSLTSKLSASSGSSFFTISK
jgi:hypothetical protein